MERLVLIGFRGTGKSTVGRAVAARLGLPFVDTDALVEEQAGLSIPAIFERRGEAAFRELERGVIAALPQGPAVVSCGGGAVLAEANVRNLRKQSLVIWLEATAANVAERIRHSSRPALTDLSFEDEIRQLLDERTPRYRQAADICLPTDGLSVRQCADAVVRLLKRGPGTAAEKAAARTFFAECGLETAALDRIDPGAAGGPSGRICAVLGNPCRHSRSPEIYNHLFSRFGLNYYYTRIEWHDPAAVLHHARHGGFRGLSVTIPFKSAVLPLLDEVDDDARAIGAVNTVVQCGGRLSGSNTDWIGILRPLRALGRPFASAVVLGAGGAAAAAVYALVKMDVPVAVLNRTPERGSALAGRFGCESGSISDFGRYSPDVIVNATPVGMEGRGGSLLSAEQLQEGTVVFDLVYTPPETALLREARRAGCTVISGTEMFVHQACAQFTAFTGIEADPALIRDVLQ